MARSSTTNLLLTVGVGFFFYTQAKSGAFGAEAKQLVDDLFKGGTANAGGNGSSGSACTGSLSAMAAGDPNILTHIGEWQAARRANGENPRDWAAFRNHEKTITGGYDPGPNPPPEFCNG